jgi:hypothetical protein
VPIRVNIVERYVCGKPINNSWIVLNYAFTVPMYADLPQNIYHVIVNMLRSFAIIVRKYAKIAQMNAKDMKWTTVKNVPWSAENVPTFAGN